jgi:hypothetical protein
MTSSICNMLGVTWKFGLAYTMVWMVSWSLGVVLASASVTMGKGYVPLSGLYIDIICSRTCLMYSNSSWIQPLWCWTSLNSSAARSYTFSSMRSTSSSVIMYFGRCLCTLAFLDNPFVCIIGHLGGHVSFGVDAKGVS